MTSRDGSGPPDERARPSLKTRRELSSTLPPELLSEAARRVGWLGLIYAGPGFLAHFGTRAILVSVGLLDAGLGIHDLLFLVAASLGVAIFVSSRRRLLSQKRLLDLGLVFYVAGALGIAGGRIGLPVPASPESLLGFVPAECAWILVYPLVVATPPRRMLLASLLAAAIGPVAVALSALGSGAALERSLLFVTIANSISAVVAYMISRMVHRSGMRLKQLREVGSYQLMAKIGQGGMGEVWRAKHRLLARPAAIKLIRPDALGAGEGRRDDVVKRFEREAQETAALGSIHTVSVYDFGTTERGEFYYVMELLDGVSLERFVKTYGPMDAARVVSVLRQVCHSLGEAHARGLVHRDIKPANILLCRLGPDDDFVKVLDFGLVKHLMTDGVTELSLDKVTVGTPAFMAPEIALGRPDVDDRADLYSLGCVAYYLLTGQLVFQAGTPLAMALAHVNEAPGRPSERSELAIPPALDALIVECLAKDASQRPPSANELAERLAATVPESIWTAKEAHRWWEVHRGQKMEDDIETVETPASSEAEQRRCWPRLEQHL
jgi:serine/threonine-protein kinase